MAGGNVYIKGQLGEEDLKWGGRQKASGSLVASGSGTSTPDHGTANRPKSSGTLASDMGPLQRSGAKSRTAAAAPTANPQKEEAKSDAAKKLEKMMADLVSGDEMTQEDASAGQRRTSKNKEPCYCQGGSGL